MVPFKPNKVTMKAKYFEVQIALYFLEIMDNFVQNFHDLYIIKFQDICCLLRMMCLQICMYAVADRALQLGGGRNVFSVV